MRERSDVGDPVGHTLAVLNLGIAKPVRAPSVSELGRGTGLRDVLCTRNRPRPETIERKIWDVHDLVAKVEPPSAASTRDPRSATPAAGTSSRCRA